MKNPWTRLMDRIVGSPFGPDFYGRPDPVLPQRTGALQEMQRARLVAETFSPAARAIIARWYDADTVVAINDSPTEAMGDREYVARNYLAELRGLEES